MKEFSKIEIMPYRELLQANIGLSTHRGGPIFPNWDAEVLSRHCRGNRIPVDHLPLKDNIVEELNLSGIWAGAICGHFGHQVSEFSMRIPEAISHNTDTNVLFAARHDSPYKNISSAPTYFRSIIDWFFIQPDRVRIINRPTMISELIVYPQAEMLNGPSPDTMSST